MDSGHAPRTTTVFGSQSAGWKVAILLGIVILVLAVIQVAQLVAQPSTPKTPGNSGDAEQAAASLKLAAAAVKAADNAHKAVEAQAAADKDLATKTREAALAKAAEESAAAEKAKAANTAAAPAAEKTAQSSKIASDKAKQDRLAAADLAVKRTREAIEAMADSQKALLELHAAAAAELGSSFHWPLFAFLTLLFLSVFPLSAFAFRRREVPRLIAQLKVDYAMLGSQQTAGTSTNDQELDDFSARWNVESYALHCLLTVLAAAVGAALFCWQPGSLLDVNTQRGMQLGFLGAYVYCLNLIYRRYTTRDLQPHVYLSCAVGLIAGMVFNYVAFAAITSVASSPATPEADGFTGVGAGAAAIMAFSLGYFPNLAVRWFGRISRTSVHERQRRSDALPLSLIDGISELHESRLQDEGIDNVQNLAAADIKDLVEKTPYSAQQIVEWVDQALLYLYVDPGEFDSFRRAGVRSVTDFRDIWAGFSIRYKVQPDGMVMRIPPALDVGDFDQRRKDIAAQLATTEQRLDCLFLATEEGPNMDTVRTYWDNVQTASIQTRDILINQVCGGVGRALRESIREGSPLSSSDILTRVAQGIFAAAELTGQEEAVSVTPESLYGQAYLKNQLKEVAEARRLYLKCIEQFPDDPVAYNDLAWLELQTNSRQSDLRAARDFAEKAVRLTAAEKVKAEQAAAQAGAKMAAEQAAGNLAEAEKAEAEQADKQAETKKLGSDLAGYRDTLALAEIRLGNIAKGEAEALKAIAEWTNLGRGRDPRFLDTLVSAAEGYLATEQQEQAKDVLKRVEDLKYAKSSTTERIKNLREKMEKK